MRTYIRRREKNRQLIILYGAWGTDENVFAPLCDDEFDFILFYNYSADEALILPETKTYDKIIVIGWAFGVWAAEYLLPKTGIKPDRAIAVNGTPIPADDKFGIPVNLIEGTLNNITEETIGKFHLRMFGDKKTYKTNIDRVPQRNLKSLHDELRWFYNRIMEQKEPGFKWDYAITSENDRVYPSSHLIDYWSRQKETKHIVLPFPHYFFHKWKSFNGFIDFVESYETKNSKQQKESVKAIINL
jgi:biotin synthesis protein BioG